MTSAQRCALAAVGRRVESVWEQKKPEARKMLEKRADSHLSAARGVGTLLTWKTSLPFISDHNLAAQPLLPLT